MKKNIFAAVFAAILLITGNASANVDASGAEAFVKNVTNDGIENIINANISQKEKDKNKQDENKTNKKIPIRKNNTNTKAKESILC